MSSAACAVRRVMRRLERCECRASPPRRFGRSGGTGSTLHSKLTASISASKCVRACVGDVSARVCVEGWRGVCAEGLVTAVQALQGIRRCCDKGTRDGMLRLLNPRRLTFMRARDTIGFWTFGVWKRHEVRLRHATSTPTTRTSAYRPFRAWLHPPLGTRALQRSRRRRGGPPTPAASSRRSWPSS